MKETRRNLQKERNQQERNQEAIMKASKFTSRFTFLVTLSLSPAAFSQAKASEAMGKALYSFEGANSCLFCHGLDDKPGNIKDSAKLAHPKTWKVYTALGGDATYKKDPKAFVEAMKAATTHLIRVGAIRHNATYKAPGYDKTKIKSYNAQMMGLSGAASVAWMNKFKDKGVTPEIAAEAAWLYLVSLDKDGILKK